MTGPVWPDKSLILNPVLIFQIIILVSSEPLANNVSKLSFITIIELTGPVWPDKVWILIQLS